MAPSVEFAGPFWLGFAQETNGIAKGKLVDPPGSIASDFVVLVLSEAVLSPPRRTVLVLDGCWNGGDADR